MSNVIMLLHNIRVYPQTQIYEKSFVLAWNGCGKNIKKLDISIDVQIKKVII